MKLGETYNANLPNGDLDGFLSDMSQPKAEYSDKEDEGMDDLFANEEEEYEEDEEDGQDGEEYEDEEEETFDPQIAALSAEFAAMITDLAIPTIIAMFVKCEPSRLQATQDQLQKLTSAYSSYLKTKQIKLSPGWMLIGVIVSIYGAKVPMAMREAKLKEKEEELKQKEAELEKRQREYEIKTAEERAYATRPAGE